MSILTFSRSGISKKIKKNYLTLTVDLQNQGSGDLENPGQLPVWQVLEGTTDD